MFTGPYERYFSNGICVGVTFAGGIVVLQVAIGK
jgi:hypothetical protein